MSYCKNCGQPLAEGSANCTLCGCPAEMGIAHCGHCGEKLVPGSMFCVKCGKPSGVPVMPQPPAPQPKKRRSRYAAAAFGIVMGSFGVHNFYIGNSSRGIAQIAITLAAYWLVMVGVLPAFGGMLLSGLWGFIEGVLIAVGDIKTDAEGNALRQWNEENT